MELGSWNRRPPGLVRAGAQGQEGRIEDEGLELRWRPRGVGRRAMESRRAVVFALQSPGSVVGSDAIGGGERVIGSNPCWESHVSGY